MFDPCCALSLVFLAASSPATEEIMVNEVRSQALKGPQREALTDLIVYGVTKRRVYKKVTTVDDIRTQLGREAERQMLGCEADAACMAEIAGALGTRFILSSAANPLGSTLVLRLNLIDTKEQSTRRALTEVDVKNEAQWRKAVEDALTELFGGKTPASSPAAGALPTEQELFERAVEQMIPALKPDCENANPDESSASAKALETYLDSDQDSMKPLEWSNTMNALASYHVIIAFCASNKKARQAAHRRAKEIYSAIAARGVPKGLRYSLIAHQELLNRNPPR